MFLYLSRLCIIDSTYNSDPDWQRDSTFIGSVYRGRKQGQNAGHQYLLTLLIGSKKACHSLG
jgi:hypothetical protein